MNPFTANDPDFLASSDLLLVTLKAWQVSNAVKNLSAILPSSVPVLLMHNGMGTVDELKSLKQPLLLASTTQAARRDGQRDRPRRQRHQPYWPGESLS